jgi:hypothetical protein
MASFSVLNPTHEMAFTDPAAVAVRIQVWAFICRVLSRQAHWGHFASRKLGHHVLVVILSSSRESPSSSRSSPLLLFPVSIQLIVPTICQILCQLWESNID